MFVFVVWLWSGDVVPDYGGNNCSKNETRRERSRCLAQRCRLFRLQRGREEAGLYSACVTAYKKKKALGREESRLRPGADSHTGYEPNAVRG